VSLNLAHPVHVGPTL